MQNNWRGVWKKALSDIWLTTRFSFQTALNLVVVSLRALFCVPLQLCYSLTPIVWWHLPCRRHRSISSLMTCLCQFPVVGEQKLSLLHQRSPCQARHNSTGQWRTICAVPFFVVVVVVFFNISLQKNWLTVFTPKFFQNVWCAVFNFGLQLLCVQCRLLTHLPVPNKQFTTKISITLTH